MVWEELSGASNFVQIFVARGVKDDTALGGFRWDPVGENRFNAVGLLVEDTAVGHDEPRVDNVREQTT